MKIDRFAGLLVIGCAVVSTPAPSHPLFDQGFVAICSEPHGPSLEYGWLYRVDGKIIYSPDDGFREGSDGFSNMNPVFIYRPEKPRIILSIWDGTRPDGVSRELLDKLSEESVDRNVVIATTEEMISAVARVGNEVWLTTLAPDLEVGYFSYHEVTHPSKFSAPPGEPDSSARSSALHSKCTFSKLKE